MDIRNYYDALVTGTFAERSESARLGINERRSVPHASIASTRRAL
jgi:hypothetical protein